jgi:cytochrome c oxidase assembly protein subunit 15
VDDPRLRRLLAVTTTMVFAQILLGATMRHSGAGLAIPDFPLAFGRLVPPFWNTGIAVHFAHRMGAIVVTILIVAVVVRIARRHGSHRELVRPARILALAVSAQVTLGAFVVLTGKQPIVNTLHVATGALVLATSLLLTLRTFRVRFGARATSVAAPPRSTAAAPAGYAGR